MKAFIGRLGVPSEFSVWFVSAWWTSAKKAVGCADREEGAIV
jgi:hypothetical protein